MYAARALAKTRQRTSPVRLGSCPFLPSPLALSPRSPHRIALVGHETSRLMQNCIADPLLCIPVVDLSLAQSPPLEPRRRPGSTRGFSSRARAFTPEIARAA